VNQHLRFQLPAEVLPSPAELQFLRQERKSQASPFQVERVRLTARISAPGRRVAIAGRAPDGGVVDIFSAEGPLGDDIRVDVADARFQPDDRGGLHVDLSVGELPAKGVGPAGPAGADKWTIDYLELEVTGTVAGP
jgi:hypothetical protein